MKKNNKKTVSIGMPVYNGEADICEALESLLAQSFTDFELIISDNASTDKTGNICRSFAKTDKRVRYIQQKINKGPLWNFNFVLKKATGDYFMWAAHDDVWDVHWVQKLLKNMEQDVAISFGHVVNINHHGNVVRNCPPFDFSGNRMERLVRFYMAEEYNGKANFIYGMYHSKLVKKFRMKKYGWYPLGQDMHFVFDVIQNGKVIINPNVYLYKRLPGNEYFSDKLKVFAAFKILVEKFCYNFTYIFIASKPLDKIALSLLFPFKCLMSFVFKIRSFLDLVH